jgi:nucleotide-binding universal stress UspA family protein
MTQTILAAIDLNHPDQSRKILLKAWELAQTDGNNLAVISVLPDFGMTLIGPWFKEGAAEAAFTAAGEALHATVIDALGPEADAQVKHILRQGTAYQEILKAVTKLSPSLVVMGAHRPELKDYMIGPNSARVVRHANCSVLILRD